jgi:hypothetical protein
MEAARGEVEATIQMRAGSPARALNNRHEGGYKRPAKPGWTNGGKSVLDRMYSLPFQKVYESEYNGIFHC